MEVIPRTLTQNAGGNAIRVLTELRAKHASGESSYGIDGNTGKVVDMKDYGLWESASVKIQTLKTAIEVCMFQHALYQNSNLGFRRREYSSAWMMSCRPSDKASREEEEEEDLSQKWNRKIKTL